MTTPAPTPTRTATRRTAVALDSLADLLETVERLPEPARRVARARIEAATELSAPACRTALGLLALDLAAPVDGLVDRLSA